MPTLSADSTSELIESGASASETFDAFAWVEEALSACSGDVAPLVPKLARRAQRLAQTVHTSLQDVHLSGPALHSHLQGLQEEATPLVEHLDSVYQACCATSDSTSSVPTAGQELRLQVTLHETKGRLERCSQALVQAARWRRNVRACFASVEDPTLLSQWLKGDPTKLMNSDAGHLADRLREMHTSLDVLKDLPGALDRTQTFERLCAQMEAALVPRLASMLREDELGNVEPLRWCLDVLESVDKAHIMKDEFCQARPAKIHRAWDAYEIRHECNTSEDAFAQWLDNFYGSVLSMLQRERENAQTLFGTKMLNDVLRVLLHNTLEPLTQSFRDRLVHCDATGSKNLRLEQLVRCFHITRKFAHQLVQIFGSVEDETSTEVVESDDHVAGDTILRDAFEPYRVYFTEYAHFASKSLADALMTLVPSFNVPTDTGPEKKRSADEDRDLAPLDDFSQQLEGISETVWAIVDDSLQQCYDFTGGAAFPEALEAIGTAVQQFTRALIATMPTIRDYCKARRTSQAAGDNDSLVATPSCNQLHASLALLKACGTLECQLCAVDGRLRIRMREQVIQSFGDGSVPSLPRLCRKGVAMVLSDYMDSTMLVAAVIKIWLHDEDSTRQNRFHQFRIELLDQSAGSPGLDAAESRYPVATVLVQAQEAVRSWTKEAQLLMHDTIFLPILSTFENVPMNEIWHKVPDAGLGDLPIFSTLPQDYITMVADLLLSLLPLLEPFAESSSLEKAFVASRGTQEVCIQTEWARLGKMLDLAPLELSSCQQLFGSTAAQASVSAATEFVDLWTAAVASSTLAAYLRTVCSIPMLSEMGARQLAVDLGYFHNILNAVGCEGDFILDDVCRALGMDLQAHVDHVRKLQKDQDNPEMHVLAKLHKCIVAMRQRVVESSGATSA
ncbi:hypothetical protein PsorP6_010725 [Peronosclerospora sorghi]|uniref:Uncharacterized protein n=1 Tax=Peronosclerospora sorghi TaxID=230839 RepID=A0ACC0VVK3_9STRA|nr:hypothetical protein PsorP6_010725 [Peronosclerospora sorghi]